MIVEARYDRSSYSSEPGNQKDTPLDNISSFDEHTISSGHPSTFSAVGITAVEAPEASSSGNVWYRRYIKRFIRKNRSVPYKESFRSRIIQPVGIPVRAHLRGIHECFHPSYRHYSPLIGMIFTYNHYIDNVLRYGEDDEQDPQARLIRMLFHILPGGEIQPTHIERNAAAHLSPGLVGAIFQQWEAFQAQSTTNKDQDRLKADIETVLINHPDHVKSRKAVLEQVEHATRELQDLTKRDKQSKSTRKKIKEIEGDVIKLNKHKINRLENELSKLIKEDAAVDSIKEEMEKCRLSKEAAEEQVALLRKQIVTSLDKKQARKALKRAQNAAELEKKDIGDLSDALASSFCCASDRKANPVSSYHITIAILQAYLWRKYNSIAALKPYFESMDHIGALTIDLRGILAHVDSLQTDSIIGQVRENKPRKFVAPTYRHWSPALIEEAATVVSGEADTMDRPPIIPFSYITWAAYSEFPDCGETSLRNLLNQIVFNTDTGRFDVELLEELRELYYPRMSTRLIDFYRRYPRLNDITDQQVSVDWIEVVSNLNRDRQHFQQGPGGVRYRREMEEKNIASPLSNLLRVLNALFGAEFLDDTQFVENIGVRINELRGASQKISIDLSGLKPGGFGILGLSVGDFRYELQSYKPVHFAFVRVEKRKNQKAGQYDYSAFRKLMKYSSSKKNLLDTNTGTMSLEKLALASLFVPYHLLQNHVGSLFKELPPQFALLFANLDQTSSRLAALHWATNTKRTEQHPQLYGLFKRIENYVEPSFGPSKKPNSATGSSED